MSDKLCAICGDTLTAKELATGETCGPCRNSDTYYTEPDPLDIDYQKAKDDKNGFND